MVVWPPDLIQYRDRLMVALYEAELSFQAVGSMFGLSGQRVKQVVGAGRATGGATQPAWEARYRDQYRRQLLELVRLGAMTMTTAKEWAGIAPGTHLPDDEDDLRGQWPAPGRHGLTVPAVAAVWLRLRELVLVEAWNAGATAAELSGIVGLSRAGVVYHIKRLRQAGVELRRGRA